MADTKPALNVFTILIMRAIAFALVAYFGVKTDFAVMLTSDPDLVGAVNVAVAAGVVMLGETIGARFGSPIASLVISVASKFAKAESDKLVLPKPPDQGQKPPV